MIRQITLRACALSAAGFLCAGVAFAGSPVVYKDRIHFGQKFVEVPRGDVAALDLIETRLECTAKLGLAVTELRRQLRNSVWFAHAGIIPQQIVEIISHPIRSMDGVRFAILAIEVACLASEESAEIKPPVRFARTVTLGRAYFSFDARRTTDERWVCRNKGT